MDRILRRYKFTNAYRSSDRVSQFLIRNVIYKGDPSPREVFFRTVLFKLFNKIETWELLERELGEVSWHVFDVAQYSALLEKAMNAGVRIYSSAYIMPTATKFPATRKHQTHLKLLEYMVKEDAPERISHSRTMRAGFDILRSFPMMGDFLAYQYLIDLSYSDAFNFNEMEFVVPGPGARDGLRKCFASTGGLSEADIIRIVTERQEVEFERLGLNFRSLWGRSLQLIDCQNLFCEIDKYARVAHPEVAGISGRTRIKQMFVPSSKSISYWYPPKWGLNERISTQQQRID